VAEKRGITVETGGLAPMSLSCRLLVNCAGHGAPALARRTAGLAPTAVPTGYYRKGVYFSVSSRPFKRLIYPVHGAHGMDVHVVVDMAGNVRFGPDFEWVDRLDYTVDASRANDFYPAIRSFWSDLPDGALTPAYAGIRPKISGPGEPAVDFMIQGPRDHGVSGLVNLFGIESPGLTASLAIGEHVALLAGVMSS
jgi:L-2-hydroxyglutarate oxidase LhgO